MAMASSASACRRSRGLPMREFRTQGGEHERPIGVVRGQPVEGHLQDLDLLGVDGTGGAEEAAVVGQGGGHEPLGVTEIGGPASSAEERVAKGGVSRLALGGAEPDGQVDAEDGIGVGGLGVEIERLGVVAQRVGGGERSQGGVARLAGIADGLGQVDGLGGADPVAGQLADPCSGAIPAQLLQRLAPPAGAPVLGGWARGPHTACVGSGRGRSCNARACRPARAPAPRPSAASRMSSSSSSVAFVALPGGRDRSPGR